ncbi:hypothetical protein NBRC116188_06010 [Oceaniserpentilla sp. 4NH20-0058]
MLNRVLPLFILIITFEVLAHSGESHQSSDEGANIEAALHWIELSQQPGGNINTANEIATKFQSSAEALKVFDLLGASLSQKNEAINFLKADLSSLNTEQLSRLLLVLAKEGDVVTTEITELKSRQNIDGGFGHFGEYDSTPIDTSYALLALQGVNSDTLLAGKALYYLSNEQLESGAYALYSDQASVMVSALVTQVLKAYLYTHNVSEQLSSAIEFLYASQNSEGHWGTNWESALALQALIPVTTDVSRYASATEYLESSQSTQGDWDQTVYSTSLAVTALNMLTQIDVPVDPEKAIISGHLLDSLAGTLIPNSVIDVLGYNDENVVINSDGSFVVSNLNAESYVISYSAPGYIGASQNITLREGQFANVGRIRLAVAPTTVLVGGVITDSTSAEPIAGVTVTSVVGSNSSSAITDANGEYQLLSEPGETVLTANSSEHYLVTATASLVAGTQISFSPSLLALTETQPVNSSVFGTILDVSGQPISGVTVTSLSNSANTTTNASGYFELTELTAGDLTIQLSKDGYGTVGFSVVVPEKTNVNVGSITLQDQVELPSTTVYGQVIDMVTGLGVPAASVVIGGRSHTTDENGFYRIEGIPVLEFVISTNAAGYLFSNKEISLTEFSNLNIDINIRKADLGGVNIVTASTDKTSYGAYEPVIITATVNNETALQQSARLYVQVKNANGAEIANFTGANLPPLDPQSDLEELAHYQEHLEASIEDFAPGEERSIQLEQWWNTLTVEPGQYTITVQALDGVTGNLVSQSSASVAILPTENIAALRVNASPGYVLLNNQSDVEFFADVHNRSNVPVLVEFDYQFNTPDGQLLTQGSSQIELMPSDINKKQVLSVMPYQFVASGQYQLVLSNVQGATVENQSAGGVFVPPSIRLKATQLLSPNEVVPLEDVNVNSDIQVEGVDGE